MAVDHYKQKIIQLERELDDMTAALSHAWDQLVPFLQDVPTQVETSHDLVPILHAVTAAADTEIAGIYLFESAAWYSVPGQMVITTDFVHILATVTEQRLIQAQGEAGQAVNWALVPVFSERQIIGVLGIGTYDLARTFTAVDLRIIKRLAERIGSQVAAAQLARFRERESVRNHEFQIAREIQQSVQPVDAPRNSQIKIASYWQPAKEVGGDAWGWVELQNERLAWFILDVAGKGLPAALAAVALHTAISMALRMQISPSDTLRIVNEQLYDAYTRTGLMATAAVACLNPATGLLEIANAGHPPVLVRHKSTWLRLEATAPPIGVLPFLQPEAQYLTLKRGDLVICYSDGFTEIERRDRLWGQTGLLSSIPGGAKDVQALTRHIVQTAQYAGTIHDDQTLVTTLYR